MDKKDAQSVTQADRDAAAALLGGASPDGLLEGRQDSLSLVQAFARHRLASQPTSAEDAVAWMRRCAFEKNEGTKGNRPKGWTMHPTTIAKLFDDDVALYTRPTPDTQTAAIGAEVLLEEFDSAAQAWGWEADQGTGDADMMGAHDRYRQAKEKLRAALSQPVAAPQAEMAGGEALARLSRGVGTDQDRTDILGALLQGDLGGSEQWATAIWPVEQAFVAGYPAIINSCEKEVS